MMATIRTGSGKPPAIVRTEANQAICWGLNIPDSLARCIVPKRDGNPPLNTYISEGGIFGYPGGYPTIPVAPAAARIIGKANDSTYSGVRTRIIIQNTGFTNYASRPTVAPLDVATTSSIFIGQTNATTSANGYEIKAGESLELTTTDAIFARSASGDVGINVWEEFVRSGAMKYIQKAWIMRDGSNPTASTYTQDYSNPNLPAVEVSMSPKIMSGSYRAGDASGSTGDFIKITPRETITDNVQVGVGVIGGFKRLRIFNPHPTYSAAIFPIQPTWVQANGGVPNGSDMRTINDAMTFGQDQTAGGVAVYPNAPDTQYLTTYAWPFRLLPGKTFTTEVNNGIVFKSYAGGTGTYFDVNTLTEGNW